MCCWLLDGTFWRDECEMCGEMLIECWCVSLIVGVCGL